jgi:hypothetical protein
MKVLEVLSPTPDQRADAERIVGAALNRIVVCAAYQRPAKAIRSKDGRRRLRRRLAMLERVKALYTAASPEAPLFDGRALLHALDRHTHTVKRFLAVPTRRSGGRNASTHRIAVAVADHLLIGWNRRLPPCVRGGQWERMAHALAADDEPGTDLFGHMCNRRNRPRPRPHTFKPFIRREQQGPK